MDFIDPLVGGVSLLTVPMVIIVASLGALWGCVAGAIPGLSGSVALAVVLPLTFAMGPIEAIALLVGIVIGTGYGNSIPAVLVGVPGTPSAFLTAIDGFALHKQGKSGLALGAAYFSTVAGQWVSIILFTIMVVPLAQLAYVLLSPEIFALHLIGIIAVISLTGKNVFKGLVAAAIGLSISFVGPDPVSFIPRFDFGVVEIRRGLEVVPVVIGLLAVSEIIRSYRQKYSWNRLIGGAKFVAKFPSGRQIRRLITPTIGGTFIGAIIGAIPGVGSTAAAAVSYQQARFFSKRPEEFGEGSAEGIAANEAAGASSNAGEFVPTLGLGIPGSGPMVIVLGALSIHGLLPGPLLLSRNPELLHAAIAGLLIATLFLAVAGWWMAKSLFKATTLDRSSVLTVALFATIVGTFALKWSTFDVLVMLVAGVVGYAMVRYGYPPAAAALGVILGGGLESNFRQGLLLMDSSIVKFVSRPYTAIILLICLGLFVWGVFSTVRTSRRLRRPQSATTKGSTGAVGPESAGR